MTRNVRDIRNSTLMMLTQKHFFFICIRIVKMINARFHASPILPSVKRESQKIVVSGSVGNSKS